MSSGVYRGLLIAVFALLSVGFVAAAVILMARGSGNAPIQVVPASSRVGSEVAPANGETLGTTPTPLLVYVHGAVESPGVYSLESGDRLVDALDAAGGATEDADLTSVNLAQRVEDEGSYYVPTAGETDRAPTSSSKTPETTGGGESDPSTNSGGGGRIDLNTASVQELATLPGIGPGRAQAIVDYRSANGPFASVSEVTKVPGIADGIYQRLKDHATVGPK